MANPVQIERAELKVVGLSIRTSNVLESDPATAKIPGLWQKISQNFFGVDFAQKHKIYAVYHVYASDQHGLYSLTVGRSPEDNQATLPGGLDSIIVPAGHYLRFEEEGSVPEVVMATWMKVHGHFAAVEEPQRSFKFDVEEYNPAQAGVFRLDVGIC